MNSLSTSRYSGIGAQECLKKTFLGEVGNIGLRQKHVLPHIKGQRQKCGRVLFPFSAILLTAKGVPHQHKPSDKPAEDKPL